MGSVGDEAQRDDERHLIECAQSGDRTAQDELFRRHLPGLLAWVRLKRSDLLKGRESTVDVVQSVCRQALGDLGKFEYRAPGGFRNWLLTYADNKLRNREQFHRAERRSPNLEAEASLSQVYASICSPSQALVAREAVASFERAFGQLSESDQRIILLARIEGLSHAEIARIRGCSEDASKQALKRAIVRLASRMSGE